MQAPANPAAQALSTGALFADDESDRLRYGLVVGDHEPKLHTVEPADAARATQAEHGVFPPCPPVAPRLGTYLQVPRPTWPDIVNAADWLRGEMDISKLL